MPDSSQIFGKSSGDTPDIFPILTVFQSIQIEEEQNQWNDTKHY